MEKDSYSENDSDLIRRCKRGDESAFEEIVRKYQQSVFSLVYHNIGYRGDVEDVAQKIFTKVYLLPNPQRIAIVLRDIEDVSYERMAEILNCTEQAARLKVFRARSRLKQLVERALRRKELASRKA